MMLRSNTQKVWDDISQSPHLGGFVLIGGTALTLQIHHRLSEDIDLIWPVANGRLPRRAIDRFLLRYSQTTTKKLSDSILWTARSCEPLFLSVV